MPPPPLPPQPMRRTLRITTAFLYLSILLLIAGITRLAMLSHPARASGDTLAVLLCTFGGIGIPVCLWLIWTYRRYARRAQAILTGENRLAHWTCSQEEWDRFLHILEKRAKKNQRILLVIFAIVAALLIPVSSFALVAMTPPGKATVVLEVLAVLFGSILLLCFLCWIAVVYLPVIILRHPTSREVFIGTGGVVSAGKFISWQLFGGQIHSVRYEPPNSPTDPGTLLFAWTQPGIGAYGTSMPIEALVPVPPSHDADARAIVDYFTHRLPSVVPASAGTSSPQH